MAITKIKLTDLDRLARGKPVQREVFRAILENPDLECQLQQLRMVYELFEGPPEEPDIEGAPDMDVTFEELAMFVTDDPALAPARRGAVKRFLEQHAPELLEPAAPSIAAPETPTVLVGASDTSTRIDQAAGPPTLTELARSGKHDELAAQLRPWLPHLLEFVGLEEALAEALLDFILSRLPQIQQRRFLDCLPEWLSEFVALQAKGGSTLAVDYDEVRRMISSKCQSFDP